MPSSFDSFMDGDIIHASHVAEMHEPIQNLERGAAFYAGSSSGTSTDYTATISPGPDDPYQAGMLVNFKVHTQNAAGSPDVTLDVNGVGAKPILKNGGESLSAGDLDTGQIVTVIYDDSGSGQFMLITPASLGGRIRFDPATQNTVMGDGAMTLGTAGHNTAIGFQALQDNDSGFDNTAVGTLALANNTVGYYNSAFGSYSLLDNTEGSFNTALGFQALVHNTSGTNNVAIGPLALSGNTTNSDNIAIGREALYGNAGDSNTVVGSLAMGINETGSYNCALGALALRTNSTGESNVALGYQAIFGNTSGYANVAIGTLAMVSNGDGYENVAIGNGTLSGNTSGVRNVVVGASAATAITVGSDNLVMGWAALAACTTGNNNTVLSFGGGGAITTGSSNIVIGALEDVPDGSADNQINIGSCLMRNGPRQNVSLRAGSSAFANSSDTAILDLTNLRGWVGFADDGNGWCRLRVNPSGVSIEASSADWVASSTPASGEVGLYVSSGNLHMALGSAAARTIGFTDNTISF